MQFFWRRNQDPLNLLRFEFGQPASVGSSCGHANVVLQPCRHDVEYGCGQRVAGVEPVRDVQVARTAQVAHEGWWPSCHIGAEDGCRRPQRHRPPRRSVLCDIGFVGTECLCPCQESLCIETLVVVESVEVDGEADDPPQVRRIPQFGYGVEQLPGSGHDRQQDGGGQRARIGAGDPRPVAAGHLPSMHTEHLAEFDKAGRAGLGRVQELGPATGAR